MTKLAPFTLAFLLVARLGFAQSPQTQAPATPAPAPEYPVIRVGVLAYTQYDLEVENRNKYNAFDVTRGYLNVNGQLSNKIRFRFTPDIRRISDGSLSGTLVLRVKYAFAQFDNVGPARSWVRFGAHQTPWLDFEESINRYRVQGTMFSERENLIPGSSDFGVGYFAPVGKFVEVQGGVYNGEGYTQPDANKYKSAQGRVTVRPLAGAGAANGLRVSGFYNAGWYDAGRPRRLGIVMASYEHTKLVATMQYLKATERPLSAVRNFNRSGTSGFLEARQGLTGWAGLARFDSYDPDSRLANDYDRRVVVGGAYWFNTPRSRVGFVVTNEQVTYGTGARRPKENRILAQTHIEF
jgi:hypothetical protein